MESVYSLIPSSQTLPEETIAAGEFYLESGIELVDQPVNHYFMERRKTQPVSAAKHTWRPMQVFSIIWAAGVAALLFYGLFSYFRIRKRVRVSTAMDTAYTNRQIYICDDISAPFILGILKPHIYLPSNTKPDQIPYIVAHEMAHLKRHDHWWKPLGFLLLSIYWFHPLVWAAYLLLCKDIELACDEKVIRDMGVKERQAYSYALLANSISRRTITACPLAFGEAGVKERIQSVMNYRKPAFWLLVIAAISCIAVAVCFLTNPKQKKIENGSNENATEQGQSPEGPEAAGLSGNNEYAIALNTKAEPAASLGVDGASLHYADGDRIILSCSPYLMVYSKSERKMLGTVDRIAIGCGMTQGDSACEISVTDDGNIVYLHPMDEEKMFVYDIGKNKLEQVGYDSRFFTGIGSPTPIHVMEDDYIDYYQKDGETMFTTIWGYDTVGSLVWREESLMEAENPVASSASSIYYPFFLSGEHQNAVQFTPSDIHDLTRVQMFVDGQMKSCDDPKALQYIETHLGKADKEQINPLRPFYFPMYLTRTDGTVGIIYPAIYGGASFLADGHAYLFAGVDDEDEGSVGKQFWELLGGWFDELW